MPEQITIEVDGFGPVRFCHHPPATMRTSSSSTADSNAWPTSPATCLTTREQLSEGHTHMPFLRLVDGRLIVNPGSVGLPYGRAGARWAILAGDIEAIQTFGPRDGR